MKIKVYSGLTLSSDEVHRLLPGSICALPIRRSDILKDISDGVHVVAIIDGVFQQNLAVSPSEIMDAIRAGLRVYGSSSMGALRSAELSDFGMIGFGKIFELIRSAPFFRDDHLGQVFSESEGSIFALSQPFVDFFFNLQRLKKKGMIRSRRDFDFLAESYSELHYSERNFASLREVLIASGRKGLLDIAKVATSSKGSQKRADALGMIRRMRSELSDIRRFNSVLEFRSSKLDNKL